MHLVSTNHLLFIGSGPVGDFPKTEKSKRGPFILERVFHMS